MENKSNRTRRVLAFLTDFMVGYIPYVLATFVLWLPVPGNIALLIVLIVMIAFFVTFLLRDYLFNGRSIGKRIFKLRVVDADTLSTPSSKQLIVKNLFLFLYIFDGLFLIASGRTLSERIVRTIVTREQAANLDSHDELKGIAKKRVVVAVAVVLCISIFMFLLISTILNAVKKQENYQIACSYLINSNAYAEIQADESQITLIGYSSSTNVDNSDAASTEVIFSFLVQGRQYQVVCHQNGDMWYVCGDCTTFR